MKKWFFIFFLLLATAIAALYVFIPKKIEISTTAYINVAADVANRNLSEAGKWKNWWSGKSSIENSARVVNQGYFVYNGIGYKIVHTSMNAIEVVILPKKDTLNSTIRIFTLNEDSTALHWNVVIHTGNNPFERIRYYQLAKSIKKCMEDVFHNLRSFLEKKEKVYGIEIQRTTVTDTILITTKASFDHYPGTTDIYNLIGRLKQFISLQGARETNYPMLHVFKDKSNRYETMVAIPINKAIKGDATFAFKRMVPGNILVSEVRGGSHRIENALAEMEVYLKDYQLASPAIPFQSLVTNRTKEPDTTKWITRIYYPIY